MGAATKTGRACLHCKQPARLRARGLCQRCYNLPPVRREYVRLTTRLTIHDPGPTAAELDALEAARRPTMPAEPTCNTAHRPPAPEPGREPVPEPLRPGDCWAQWAAMGLANAAGGFLLTSETSPEQIARDQIAALREVIRDAPVGVSLEELSVAVVLPVDVVGRRLEQMRCGVTT